MPATKTHNDNANQTEGATKTPFFSVILPTRNRPELLRRALNSVLDQSFRNFEVLVVNDGSSDDHLEHYHSLESGADPRVRWHHQTQRPNGHGPSYSINTGAWLARGKYLCILDDDDSWEDSNHLDFAQRVIDASDAVVDVFYSNQTAYTSDDQKVSGPLWLEELASTLHQSNAPLGTFKVTPGTLLSKGGFPHLNCTIMRRELFLQIGGMDEGIRYECEVDLYLRTLSEAGLIIYSKRSIGRHNVPRQDLQESESTMASFTEKRLSQTRIYQKNLALTSHSDVARACQARLADVYRHLAADAKRQRHYLRSALFARLGLACRYSLKWQAYTWYLATLALLGRRSWKP